jgi:hypothetical protein
MAQELQWVLVARDLNRMRRTAMRPKAALTFTLVLGLSMASVPAGARQDETTVKGEVIQVQQRARTENDGELDHLRIRTRQGEEMRLQLGKAGTCEGCVQAGDQIKARVRQGTDGAPAKVQSMQVRRQGALYSYRYQNGELVQNQARPRAQDGSGVGNHNAMRQRQQIHTAGSGSCAGGGAGNRGSGVGGGGGSRGGGGG